MQGAGRDFARKGAAEMQTLRRVLALALLAALLCLGLAESAPEDAEVEEAAGEVGEINLGLFEDAPETAAPEEKAGGKARKKSDATPWLTSYNYPDGKINFEDEIWRMLTRSWGLADYQAAGLMGSIRAESSFCPYNAQNREGVDDRGKYAYRTGDGVGFGLCQWTSPGRKAALLRHAEAHGSADLVWDFDIQMGFLGSELDFGALTATRTLYEAAEWAVLCFERPNQRYPNSWPGTRYEQALALYKAHTGRDYEEPALEFEVARDGEPVGEGLALPGDIAVRSNYYWRLEVDGDWLEATCPALYGDELEACRCGYALDGEKPVYLAPALPLLPGGDYRATLRFEIFRGEHVTREVTVRAARACTPGEWAKWAGEIVTAFGELRIKN